MATCRSGFEKYDWLANMVEWTDDAHAFYERSIGDIENGFEHDQRPSALYLSTDLHGTSPTDRGGWVALDYGEGGNVVAMTVHGQCADAASETCGPPTGSTLDARRADLRNRCKCAEEQHYRYRWDELNRLAEARRYDRHGTGRFELVVRQRYRYDAGNQRTVKQTIESDPEGDPDPPRRTQLYVYPGDYGRSGVRRQPGGYVADATLGTETQYLVGGARIVWKAPASASFELDRDVRMTYALTDLIQSTSAVIDLYSGELLETASFYPNGGQQTHLTQRAVSLQPQPFGFTGKEADDEVGVVSFGERYLIPRIGRWASPDPLHVHAGGGGEALNSYHYVAGSLLQARDPHGLNGRDPTMVDGTPTPTASSEETAERAAQPNPPEAEAVADEVKKRAKKLANAAVESSMPVIAYRVGSALWDAGGALLEGDFEGAGESAMDAVRSHPATAAVPAAEGAVETVERVAEDVETVASDDADRTDRIRAGTRLAMDTGEAALAVAGARAGACQRV